MEDVQERTIVSLPDKKFAWLLETIIAVLLAIMGTGLGMYIGLYKDVVTKTELPLLVPYPKDAPIINKHMKDSETTLEALTKSINLVNARLEAVNYEHSLKIDRLEQSVIRFHQQSKIEPSDN